MNTVTEAYVPWQQYSTLALSFSFFRHLFISCPVWLIQLDVQETGNRMIRMTSVLLFERLAERPGPHSRTLAVREREIKEQRGSRASLFICACYKAESRWILTFSCQVDVTWQLDTNACADYTPPHFLHFGRIKVPKWTFLSFFLFFFNHNIRYTFHTPLPPILNT